VPRHSGGSEHRSTKSDVRHAERTGGMAGASGEKHLDYRLANVVVGRELELFLLGEHGIASRRCNPQTFVSLPRSRVAEYFVDGYGQRRFDTRRPPLDALSLHAIVLPSPNNHNALVFRIDDPILDDAGAHVETLFLLVVPAPCAGRDDLHDEEWNGPRLPSCLWFGWGCRTMRSGSTCEPWNWITPCGW